MRSIVFNPEWVVPETIKTEDLQPRLRQRVRGVPDVSVLRENRLSVSYQGKPVNATTIDWNRANIHAYTFTQAPGPSNVLGTLKFNFPNRHAVYMHDTVQPALFKETVRIFSHGCIRVHEPERLAALLLAEDKGWLPEQVKSMLARGRNSAVPLSRPVPVHLTYFTLAYDGVGKLQTYADIYGLDGKMAPALFGKSELLAVEAAPAPSGRSGAEPPIAAWAARYFRACSAISSASATWPRRFAAASTAARIARASSAERGVARAHHQHQVAGARLFGDPRHQPVARGREFGLRPDAAISATISAAEKSRVAVPPA